MSAEWIQWQGDGRTFKGPVADDVIVEIMMLDGEVWQEPAGELNWGVVDVPGEIIAYRIPTSVITIEKEMARA